MPNIWSIIWFTALAVWDYIVVHSALPDWLWVKPPDDPPEAWLWRYSDSLWRGFVQAPSARETWTRMMLEAAGTGYQRLAEWARDNGRDWAVDIIRATLGVLSAGYGTFAHWINSHDLKIGGVLPWWCFNLIDGLAQLWDRLPEPIRDRIKSWADWLDAFLQGVRNWAQDRYDAFRKFADDAWKWVAGAGQTLHNWWNTAHVWLDDWRSNWWTRIKDKLGSPWTQLITFASGSLMFWYNLWSGHGSDIGGLLSDPLRWLYDRVENWILEKVW